MADPLVRLDQFFAFLAMAALGNEQLGVVQLLNRGAPIVPGLAVLGPPVAYASIALTGDFAPVLVRNKSGLATGLRVTAVITSGSSVTYDTVALVSSIGRPLFARYDGVLTLPASTPLSVQLTLPLAPSGT